MAVSSEAHTDCRCEAETLMGHLGEVTWDILRRKGLLDGISREVLSLLDEASHVPPLRGNGIAMHGASHTTCTTGCLIANRDFIVV